MNNELEIESNELISQNDTKKTKEKKSTLKVVFIALAIVFTIIIGIVIGIFIPNFDAPIKSEIIVYDPITERNVENFGVIKAKYTGSPIVFDCDLKLATNKYPEVTKKYITISYNGVEYPIDDAVYPQEVGIYEISLYSVVPPFIWQRNHNKIEDSFFDFVLVIEE